MDMEWTQLSTLDTRELPGNVHDVICVTASVLNYFLMKTHVVHPKSDKFIAICSGHVEFVNLIGKLERMPNMRKRGNEGSINEENSQKKTCDEKDNEKRECQPSNESKQTLKRRKSEILVKGKKQDVVRRINVEKVKPKQMQKGQKAAANFMEDDEHVTFRVGGQDSKFYSDVNDNETEDEESELMEEGEIAAEVVSTNNNAVRARCLVIGEDEGFDCDSRADTIKDQDELIIEPEEEEFFNKWEFFLKKRGLQITPIENNKVEKLDKVKKRKKHATGSKKEGKDLNLDSKHGNRNQFNETNSETTCYEPAVEKLTETICNRFSSSSDEADISDPKTEGNEELKLLINRFINDQRLSLEQRRSEGKTEKKTNYDDTREPQPHCSRDEPRQDNKRPNLHQRTEQLVRDVENAKAKMLNVPGKDMGIDLRNFNRSLAYSHLVDDDYHMVASHLEEGLVKKIETGKYVDFGKLLPKDKVQVEEDHRMEIVNKGRFTYWVPLSDCDKTSINSLDRWDAAFRVYQKIYTLRHPTR